MGFPKPAQRTLDWVGLRVLKRADDCLAVSGFPPDRRSPERALPAIRVIQAAEDRQLLAHLQHRNPVLRSQGQHHVHPDTARIDLRTPDRLLIEERLARDFQQADPPRHAGQIAQQVVAGLDLLDGGPAFFTEARYLAAVIKELLPGFDGK